MFFPNHALDSIEQNFSEEDAERTKNTAFNSTLSVLNAAGRWRRKHRKMSAKQISSRSNSAVRAKVRTVSATTPNIVSLPKLNYNLPKTKPNYDSNRNVSFDSFALRSYISSSSTMKK
jgi:hypothetical protein